MTKFLIFLAIVGLVLLIGRSAAKRGRRAPPAPPAKGQPEPEKIVRCSYCATYVPLAESCRHDGKDYCCDDHYRRAMMR
jgi:uncharacterized protein